MGRRNGTKTELLRDLPLFAACTDAELRRVARLLDELEVGAGTTYAVEGARAREFVVVVDGLAAGHRRGDLVETWGPGDHIGTRALLADTPASATITAATDMRVLVADARRFASLVQTIPQVAYALLRHLALDGDTGRRPAAVA
jgi:CRP-like cAMP-binding protein